VKIKKSIAIGGFLVGVSVLAIDIPGVIRHFRTAYGTWDHGHIWNRI
jgi:hypothetical protein